MSFILEKGTTLDFSFLESFNFNFWFGLLLTVCVIILIIAGLNDDALMLSFSVFIVGAFIILIIFFSISLFTDKEKEYYVINGNNGYKSYSVNISKEEYEALKRKQSFKKPELTVEEVESVLGDLNEVFKDVEQGLNE